MTWNDPAPGERDAEERSWSVVRAAWAERDRRAPRRFRPWPVVALAAALAVAAAASSPPGTAVFRSIRDAVRGEPNAAPALFSLPSPGRLLVDSERGVWVVQRDGTKRLLHGYRDASWSPHGKYLAAVRGQELRAIETNGSVHWSLARRGGIRFPVWSDASPPCCRIAYLAGNELRVVNGDGTGDRLVARRVRSVAPAWEPRTHAVAFVAANGDIAVANADSAARKTVIQTQIAPRRLLWTLDGRQLLAAASDRLTLFAPRGPALSVVDVGTAGLRSVALGRDARRYALVRTRDGRSVLESGAIAGRTRGVREIFAGPGDFGGVVWSPDMRWLLVDWDSADQWLFVPSTGARRTIAVANIANTFGANARIAGWCCP